MQLTMQSCYLNILLTPQIKPTLSEISWRVNANSQSSQPAMQHIYMSYSSTVWSPHLACDINKLEMTKYCSARFVFKDFKWTPSVTSMLNNLHWPTLETRRQHDNIIAVPHDHLAANYNCITYSWSQFQVYFSWHYIRPTPTYVFELFLSIVMQTLEYPTILCNRLYWLKSLWN